MSITVPLASNQRDVWYDQAAYRDCPVYNIGGYLSFDDEIDYKLLEKAISQLILENDALRLAFYEESGHILQSISEAKTFTLEFIDFSSSKNPKHAAQEWLNHSFQQPFLLEQKNSLSQFAFIKESTKRSYLLTKYHHIIADGWTTKVVIARLAELYNALLQNHQITNAPQHSYFDYVKQEQEYLASDAYQRDANYWMSALQTLPPSLIEKRYPITQNEPLPKANIHKFTLSRLFYNSINLFAQDHKSTTYHVLLSALALYFSRTTQQNEIVIGIPSLNRNGARFKDVLGMFVSLSPLTLDVDISGDINQLMKTCGKTLREVYRHQRFPLGTICKRLEIMRNKRDTLFDLVLSYERQEYSMPFGNAAISAHQQFNGVARYPLAVTICEFHDLHDVDIVMEGAENAFTCQDLDMLGNRIQLILEQMISRPQTLISAIDLLPANEKYLLFEQLNNTTTKTPLALSVTQQFRHQAALNPDAIAVEYSATKLSYRQLDLLSDHHAQPLIHLGASANKIVAICLPRCPEMIMGILAVLKTAAAYLPIDPDTPTERITEILRQSKALALLSVNEQKQRLSALHPHLLILDEPLDHLESHPDTVPKHLNTDKHDLAYIIFTSGSTGRPKGVMLEHEALSIRLRWLQKAFQITSEDRIAQTIQFSFDPAIIEIFLALTQGACLVLTPARHQTPETFAQFIVEQKVNALALVPSSLRNLMQGLEQHATTSLRVVCCGGEVLPAKLASEFINKTGARLLNVYGPTETAILASAFECTEATSSPLPIGRPIDDTRIYIVDKQLKLLPIGITGEIVIGGEAVARGYLYQDDLTRERFLPDPYHSAANSRLYKTGDIGYIGTDNQLYFVGRIDNQIKISGYRIELGEIETLLARHPKVRAAAVKVIENNHQRSIYAYVTAIAPSAVTPETLAIELSKLLRSKLPDYMQPRAIISIDTMPIKPNGKIDYDSLPRPEQLPGTGTVTGKLPTNPLEIQLLQLWVDTLKTHEIGIEDNFFELGGDSLAAVTLMMKIEQLFGIRHSLSLLLENPTISLLAEVLSQKQASVVTPLLITLSENKTACPFYLAASGHGDRIRFANLAEKLGGSCTLHMLQPPAPSDSYLSIEAIANAYAEAILKRNEAPGYIGGFSIGGITALETARILAEQGKRPRGILLLDTVYPRWPLKSHLLFWLLRSFAKLFRLNKAVINGRYLEVMFADPGIATQLLAIQHHKIKPFEYPVVLFMSAGMKPFNLWTFSKWSNVLGNLTRHPISGSHGGIFQPPHLQNLVNAIRMHIKAS